LGFLVRYWSEADISQCEWQIQSNPTLSRHRRDAYRTHGLPWAFNRLTLFSINAPLASVGWGRASQAAAVGGIRPDQFLDDIVNRTKRRKAALGNDAMRRTIGFFEHRVGLRVSCYLLPQWGDSFAGSAAEPKKRSERKGIRIKEYPQDTGGGPLKQL
jgi:hypothetical protein